MKKERIVRKIEEYALGNDKGGLIAKILHGDQTFIIASDRKKMGVRPLPLLFSNSAKINNGEEDFDRRVEDETKEETLFFALFFTFARPRRARSMKYPNLREEKKLWRKGYKRVTGLDEAGRGPLSGPVVAAAVLIQNTKYKILNTKIKDSKQLSRQQREFLYKVITKDPNIEWGIGRVSEKVIDRINIKNAAELAMLRAVQKLKSKPDFLIIDGSNLKNYKLKTINYKLIVKADEKVFSCSAASILAKVTRDRIMRQYHRKYPRYRFDLHKGYGTKLHFKMLKKHGPCKIHRKTFSPLKRF